MPTNILLSENNFFRSNQIKVYPASFRGSYPQGDGTTKFDPESTLTTEYNITRPVIAGSRTTYIISWDGVNRKLTCVIGGYYFEISGITASALSNKYLCINKRTIDLNNTDTDSQRTTSVLASFRTDSIALDEPDNHNNYFFTGLLISEAPVEGTASEFGLKAFLDNGTINYAEFIPDIRNGSGNKNSKPTSLVFGTLAAATANRSIAVGDQAKATGEHSFAFSSGAFATADNAIAIGNTARSSGINAVAIGNGTKASGKYAISLGNKAEAIGINSYASGYRTLADGSYSQASGNTTQAHGEASVAEGNSTTTYGKYSHASGNGTQANGDCSVAFGDHTVADQANQFVLGAFNENKENNLFEIGNGTTDSHKNIFEVSSNGDTTLHSLAASGDIKVTGAVNLGDGKFKIENNKVTVKPSTTFNNSVKTNDLTVATGHNLDVTGKLKTANDGSTIYKKLTIDGDNALVYDTTNSSLTIGNHSGSDIGRGSVILGSGSKAAGANTFAMGGNNVVSGESSAAFGASNSVTFNGIYSFVAGHNNKVDGSFTVTMGNSNTNEKAKAVVFGEGNIANSLGELVIGSYNKEEDGNPEYFAIGNGTGKDNRNTAFKVASTGADKPTEVYIDGKSVATHVSEDNSFKQFLLNSLYPVGSVYTYSGSKNTLTKITVDGKTKCECPIKNTLGGTWEPIEDCFLYTGDQALPAGSKYYAHYNALNHTGGSNKAYLVEHNHWIAYNSAQTTSEDLTNNLFIGVPTGNSGRATVWPNASDNNAPEDKKANWKRNYGSDLNTVGWNNNKQGYITVTHENINANGFSDFGQMMDRDGNMHEDDLMGLFYRKPTVIKFNLNHQHKITAHHHDCGEAGKIKEDNPTANMPKYLCVYAWKRVK